MKPAEDDEGGFLPRSPEELAKLRKALGISSPAPGVSLATPVSTQIATWTRTQVRGRGKRPKTESRSFSIPPAVLYVGLGLFALYEAELMLAGTNSSFASFLSDLNRSLPAVSTESPTRTPGNGGGFGSWLPARIGGGIPLVTPGASAGLAGLWGGLIHHKFELPPMA